MYVELHCHSCFSLREGASTPVELLDRAAALGYDALALTDHDNLHGAMEFARAARERGIRPITGAEITLTTGHHLTLLVESPHGYANLCRLISAAHEGTMAGRHGATPEPEAPSLTAAGNGVARPPRRGGAAGEQRSGAWDALGPSGGGQWPVDAGGADDERPPARQSDAALDPAYLSRETTAGLIALSGCRQGEIAALVQAGRHAEAEVAARRYRSVFSPGSFYVELQQNLVYGDTARNAALVDLADHLGIEIVATNNVHYHLRERARLHDVLVAIRHLTTLDASHRVRRANAEFFLKPPAEMAALFRRSPRALRATRAIAERCAGFDLTRDLRYTFPDYGVPPGQTPDQYLRHVCERALPHTYGLHERALRREAEERLEEELRLIAKHNLAGFFLTYRDILTLAGEIAHELRGRDPSLPPEERPVGRGRGSSVSSLVCHLIGLSHVDPVRNRLFLGRFLNDELASVPDIDLDFPRDIRAALIERMYDRYPGRVGLVCILPTYRLRSAIRDVGKALGLPAIDLETIARHADYWSRADNVAAEMTRIPGLAGRTAAPVWRDLIDLSAQLAGFPRHVGQHVGGMVLSAEPIREVVPVQPARMPGRFLIQWDKDSADDARFVKIDFLALGMLSLVDECLDTIEERHGRRIDFSREGYEDPRVYDRICAADTVGIFQIESRAQIQTLPHTQPRNLDDLAVEVAIIRPGPIVSGAFRPYMDYRRRLAAGEKVEVHYDHPLLESVLSDTLGVILYQEQVLQVAMTVAGFTAGQGESLRRAMSRRRSHEAMASHWPRFRDGAAANGVPEATAHIIFQKLLGFAAFGFPKSHAVAFARLAYESAWLRQFFPVEYYAALFNNQPMGFYQPNVLVGDARRHGIQVVRPDINRSGVRATVESDGAFRLGLAGVREVSVEAAERIVAGRAGGPYRSLFDFVQRTRLHRAAIEHLIVAGAFDDLGLARRELLWQLGLFVGVDGRRRTGATAAKEGARQGLLPLPVEGDMLTPRPMTRWEQLVADYHVLGLSPTAHPLGLLRRWLGEGLHTSRHVERLPQNAPVRIAGMVVCRQRPGTAKGVLFMLLEDELGLTNVVVHPNLYERQRTAVRIEPFVVVDGVLQRRGPTVSVLARAVTPLRPPADLLPPAARNFH